MRILLTANACYLPTRGGSMRSNRAWLERLAEHGHECVVITPAADTGSDFKLHRFSQEARAQNAPECVPGSDAICDETVWNGVCVRLVRDHSRMIDQLEKTIANFEPDWILVSSEDFRQALLRSALRISPERTIYLGHTPQFFPFGPDSLIPHAAGAKAVSNSAEVIVISEYARQYFEFHLKRSPLTAHPPVYGSGPFPDYGPRNCDFISIINPCAVKGISIFVSLAARCKEFEFAALPGWGTTAMDLETLRAVGVRILPPCRDIDEFLAQTRILLVPSLWPEGFGLVVMEAMLRGIPVLSSDLGGLPEAKQGAGYVFPVRPIRRYLPKFDEQQLPIAEAPDQDIDLWYDAIIDLTSNPELYQKESRKARDSANQFLNNLDPDKLETALTGMLIGRQSGHLRLPVHSD